MVLSLSSLSSVHGTLFVLVHIFSLLFFMMLALTGMELNLYGLARISAIDERYCHYFTYALKSTSHRLLFSFKGTVQAPNELSDRPCALFNLFITWYLASG